MGRTLYLVSWLSVCVEAHFPNVCYSILTVFVPGWSTPLQFLVSKLFPLSLEKAYQNRMKVMLAVPLNPP